MDSLIAAAARALASGDPLGALNRVALRDDGPALALRGIAMAQLGDLDRAKTLLKRAARAFGPKEAVARARCVVAEAEIALVSRDLSYPTKTLDQAREALEAHGDIANAAQARYLEIRRLLLIGRLGEAERRLEAIDAAGLPAALQTIHALAVAGIAMRRVQASVARAALARAGQFAREARIPALVAEVEGALRVLDAPATRLIAHGAEVPLRLDDVEALVASPVLIIDACRNTVRQREKTVSLASRPVLFALARALGEAWPGGVSRAALIATAFRGKDADDSHRARLRVEIGRLRRMAKPFGDIDATKEGFVLKPRDGRDVAVLAPPVDDENASVLALLADGESWSSSALALACGASQRTVQRALDDLALGGKVEAIGLGRARRWMTPPMIQFATALLLPAALPGD